MPAMKTLAIGVLVLGALTSMAEGAPMRRAFLWRRAWLASDPFGPISAPNPVARVVPTAAPASASTQTATPAPGPSDWVPGFSAAYRAVPNAVATPAPMVETPVSLSVMSATADPVMSFQAAATPSYAYDALVNLGDGPFPAASELALGSPQPWYMSPVVTSLYGHVPNPEERAAFSGQVLQRVEDVFARSGLDVSLTDDPSASAAHTLSVISNATANSTADAIGLTNMGGDGFSFIDKFGYADSVDDLNLGVAHNVAHELIHAFDVGHHDTTGQFLDAGMTPWDVLTDPNVVFSPDAVSDLMAQDFGQRGDGFRFYGAQETSGHGAGCKCACHGTGGVPQVSPVPEPTTVAIWTLAGLCVAVARYRRRQVAAAA